MPLYFHEEAPSLVVASPFVGWLSSLGAVLVVLEFGRQVIITDRLPPRLDDKDDKWMHVGSKELLLARTAPCHALFDLLVVVVLMIGAHGPRCLHLGHFGKFIMGSIR